MRHFKSTYSLQFTTLVFCIMCSCASGDPLAKFAENRFTLYLQCGYCSCWPPVLQSLEQSDPSLAKQLTVVTGKQCDVKEKPFANSTQADTAFIHKMPVQFSEAVLIYKNADGSFEAQTFSAAQSDLLHQRLRSIVQ